MKILHAAAIAMAFAVPAIAAETAPAAAVAATAPAPAAEAAPEAVVRQLYESYFADLNTPSNDVNVAWWDFSAAYLAPDLAARIKKTEDPNVGPLDVNFLIVAQDFENLKLTSVETTASDATTATVRVTFSNMGAPSVSDVVLAKLPEGWRITDIIAGPGTADQFSLTGILKDLGV